MSASEMARRAAQSACFQRRNGDRRPLRDLFVAAYSLLRFLHARRA